MRTRPGTSVMKTCSTTCMGWADNQLIATGDSCEAKGCSSMTVRGRKTQPLLLMAIQITHKQERGSESLKQERGSERLKQERGNVIYKQFVFPTWAYAAGFNNNNNNGITWSGITSHELHGVTWSGMTSHE